VAIGTMLVAVVAGYAGALIARRFLCNNFGSAFLPKSHDHGSITHRTEMSKRFVGESERYFSQIKIFFQA
jgi:hypothetical protein